MENIGAIINNEKIQFDFIVEMWMIVSMVVPFYK